MKSFCPSSPKNTNYLQSKSTTILGVFPLHQIAHVRVSPRISLKLFGREMIFEVVQPVWSRYLNAADRRTGTNDMLWH